jgi:uncharacterized lipoprotein YbaY
MPAGPDGLSRGEIMTRFPYGFIAAVLASGCTAVPAGSANQATSTPPYAGRIWVSTDTAAAPGTLRIFLADGSMVMGSCVEVYRLVKWRAIDDKRLEWTEDTARIEAEAASVSADRLQLRLRLANEVKEENYRLAQVPFVCPDMRPGPAASPSESVVKGTVADRERIALPADAVVEVWLTDISPGLVTMAIVAQATVKSGGRQVPLPFELRYDPSRIDKTRSYGVRAVIKSGEKTLFESESPATAISQGVAKPVNLMLKRGGG